MFTITVKQFPEIATGTVQVTVVLPGATPQEVASAIVEPIENGVEGPGGGAARALHRRARRGHRDDRHRARRRLARGARRRRDRDRAHHRLSGTRRAAARHRARARRARRAGGDLGRRRRGRGSRRSPRRRARSCSISAASRRSRSPASPPTASTSSSPATRSRPTGWACPRWPRGSATRAWILSGGRIETGRERILLRAVGEEDRAGGYRDKPLLTGEDGTTVRVGDIATVREVREDDARVARLGDAPAVLVSVYRVGDEQVLELVDAVQGYVDDTLERLAAGRRRGGAVARRGPIPARAHPAAGRERRAGRRADRRHPAAVPGPARGGLGGLRCRGGLRRHVRADCSRWG